MGRVVLACDLGDGNAYHLEADMPTRFTLCDNKWHTITGLFNSKELAVRVDQQQYVNRLFDPERRMPGKIATKSPLYIGGVPGESKSEDVPLVDSL